jgi:hypothetical protein
MAAGGLVNKCSDSLWCPCPKCVENKRKAEEKSMQTTLEVARRMGVKAQMTIVLAKPNHYEASNV